MNRHLLRAMAADLRHHLIAALPPKLVVLNGGNTMPDQPTKPAPHPATQREADQNPRPTGRPATDKPSTQGTPAGTDG